MAGGIWIKVFPPGGAVPGELPGLGGWADVTAVTGNPTKHAYTDADGHEWVAYEWTGAGSVTTTEGLLDTFLISGGSGGTAASTGAGGRIADGLRKATAATFPIAIGGGGITGGGAGGRSAIQGVVETANSPAFFGGSGAFIKSQVGFPDLSQPAGRAGRESAITGAVVEYGQVTSAPRANKGDGHEGAAAGSSGVVIIRVPKANAKA